MSNKVTNSEAPAETGRDAIRSAIFANARPQSKEVEFFGAKLELRQPAMSVVMELQQLANRSEAAAQMIVGYAFVPGTNEKVFDAADIAQITNMPFGADMVKINQAITALTDIDILGAEGNSETTTDS